MGLILQKLENMDKKLGWLDSIQSSISNITVKVSGIEKKVHGLETKADHIEASRQFDSDTVIILNRKQKELDTMIENLKKPAKKC